MRTLGSILLVIGLLWAGAAVPLFYAHVTATTSASLNVLTGRDSLSHEEVQDTLWQHASRMKRFRWHVFFPTLVTFCGGILVSLRPRPAAATPNQT